MPSRLARAAVVGAALTSAACAHVGEPGETHYYLGWVRVEQPKTTGPDAFFALRTSALGLRVGTGLALGYMREQRVSIPMDCRVVVLVANDRQLAKATDDLTAAFGKEGICVAPYSTGD